MIVINSKQFLVCPMKHPAVLMNISGDHRVVPLDDDVSIETFIALLLHNIYLYMHSFIILFLMTHWPNNIGPFLIFQSDLNIVASYDRRGKHIYTGNAKGRVRERTADILFSIKWQNVFFVAFSTVLNNDILTVLLITLLVISCNLSV